MLFLLVFGETRCFTLYPKHATKTISQLGIGRMWDMDLQGVLGVLVLHVLHFPFQACVQELLCSSAFV